ncbi:cytochrome C biogenesis protein CcdA [Corynebacterium ulcerans]|nr:cytochrome c biogenesis CcdA family protein [Corynebacterium ulcerans]BBJ71221.1 cytochrome C biogenesis protein CcdA [Corynebacterium ulcerans]BBJ73528.1 cytochrome C biogenesis protein CcdA [Corynebacterium ulcerans]
MERLPFHVSDIGLLGAFLGGILALLSPCSALLLPAFFAYAFQRSSQIMARTGVFFLGLAAVLVPVGTAAGRLGGFLALHRETLILGGGIVIVVLGIFTFFGGGISLPGLSGLAGRVRGQGWLSVFLLGAAYGFSGFCAGPLLGAVLTTAVVSASSSYGALVLGCYALGMVVPLVILALFWERIPRGALGGKIVNVGPLKLNTMSMISGVIFVIIGLVFIFTHATTGLPGLLSIETQSAIQAWVLNVAANVSNLTSVLIVLGIIAVGLVIYILRTPEKGKRD